MVPIYERAFDELPAEAVSFHGHVCPGQVLGVRMTQAGCREVGVDRCATDAIEALTGVSLGKRTLKHADSGKTAATLVNRDSGASVRVVARDSARDLAVRRVADEPDPRRAQTVAYRSVAEDDLLKIEPVVVVPAWLERRRVRRDLRELRRRRVLPARGAGGRVLRMMGHAGHRQPHGGHVDPRIGERGWIDETS